MLDRVTYDTSGYDHEAKRVTFCDSGRLPFIALTHHWKTRHTSTDSEGRTRTEVRHHDEDIIEFLAPRGFGNLSLNQWRLMRSPIRFESSQFNDQFKVRSTDERFAHDVIHPRMMEFLHAAKPPGFAIQDGRIRPDLHYSVENLSAMIDFLEGFFGRVPSFVWKNLGYAEPPFPQP
ncbi:DUF3137 domain-containing protein [Ammonicoccus fulvus]|uniref:DUF3137 domain-containing protein n=1 Tax=Ammonicoccus fulvus TaxID=3138240 RepID=A0ABZ3FKH9_9ACTN